MENLKRQVRQARRRLAWQQFLGVLAWCWFGTLLVAMAGVAVAKIWPINIDGSLWASAWIGGALAGGLLLAAIWTFAHRRSWLDAALEIDRRFGLKERVSSALALDPAEVDTEAGRALLEDAVRRAQKIDVARTVRDRVALELTKNRDLLLFLTLDLEVDQRVLSQTVVEHLLEGVLVERDRAGLGIASVDDPREASLRAQAACRAFASPTAGLRLK